MLYAAAVVERAMKMQEVILRALSGALTWLQAADILDLDPRTLRRWRARFDANGALGLYDRRRQPSRRQAPALEVKRILTLYRDTYRGFNVRHFYQVARREHGVTLSYSFVRLALQEAGLVRKRRARPPSPSARAAPPLRRAPAPGWPPPGLADALSRPAADAHRRARRRHQAAALRPALARGDAAGRHERARSRRAYLRLAARPVYRSRRLGLSHAHGGRARRSRPPHPRGPRPRAPGHRAHRRLLPTGARPGGTSEPHPPRSLGQRAAARRDHVPRGGQRLPAGTLHRRLQRHLHAAAHRSHLGLRRSRRRRSRSAPLRRGGARRRPGQRGEFRGPAPPARQAAWASSLRRPARRRAPPLRRLLQGP